jgi:hypothetical protein
MRYALHYLKGYNMNECFTVMIDGKPNTLTLVYVSANGDKQYNTAGNASGHTFGFSLEKGMKFRTNGHSYEIIERI